VFPYTLVRGTMLLATVAWAAGEVMMRRSARYDRFARTASTIGIALALLHVGLAFQFVYAWNHEEAIAATVRQSVDRFGWGWRGGIYVNYLFLSLWLVDVGWWWLAPVSHSSRARWFETTRLGIFVFMFVNGAIVFASGIGRLVGVASVAAAVLGSLARHRRRDSTELTSHLRSLAR
jgi:hypothetical protein